ncbi:MAG TPA: hypothetical protein VND65_12940 [Candidatus Binatia bacterium]|nr:hypothetical protein [Candidatus Binatia bacterium]
MPFQNTNRVEELRPQSNSTIKERLPARLRPPLERKLFAYTAAGAGLICCAAPAHAEIVYTPSNTPMVLPTGNAPAYTKLDLNNDGVADFTFSLIYSFYANSFQFHSDRLLGIYNNAPGNEVLWAPGVDGFAPTAAAVPAGRKIGAQNDFQSGGLIMAIEAYFGPNSLRNSGSWRYPETAYVGLKFLINGQVHYGWARIKFPAPGNYELPSIYGYAYESTPNTPIVAGQTSGTANASLGTLAAGAAGEQNQ